jgi:hypothetical protein
MPLKYKYPTKQEIPAEQQALYVEREGAFYLDAEGMVEKTKADELRDHNIELRKQIEERDARFNGIDPEEVRKLAAEKERLEEEQRLKDGKFQEVMDSRLKTAKTEWEKQLNAVTSERDTLNTRLTTIQVDQGVITAATKRGLRPTAILDITARARSVFKLVNGVPQAFEPDGKTVRYGKDGMTPMNFEEWIDTQVADAPHLFESNAGGGAAGNGGGAAAGSQRSVKNPFRKETWNLTEQMKLQKSDPALAARLRAAA